MPRLPPDRPSSDTGLRGAICELDRRLRGPELIVLEVNLKDDNRRDGID
jgi:hypothetical protein